MTDHQSDFGRRSYEGAEGEWSTERVMGRVGEGDNGSDERIREDVCDRLMQLGPVDCTEIGVTVTNGLVRIDGTLPSDEWKQRVFDVVSTVKGVDRIESHLRVGG
jgi:osmotically-inducible protein OsmY